MRIGMCLFGGTYPPDVRVEKEAKILAAAGHEVFLIASDKDGRAERETLAPIEVRRYPHRAGWLASKATAIATILTWRSPLWESHMERFVRENDIQALHVHDLPAVASAIAVGRKLGIPVSYDMHEYYPAAVEFWPRTRTARLFQTPARYHRYERKAVTGVDMVIPAVEEVRDMVLAAGVPGEQIFLFRNVENADDVVPWTGAPEGEFVVAFAGGFGPHRGVDTLVKAMPELRQLVPGARLLLMGSGSGEDDLKAMARDLGVADAVEFTGWIDITEMRNRLSRASVGTATFSQSAHTDTMLPHKLFQYMGMGMPVVVSDCKPVARFVRETGAGEVSRSGDPSSLAKALAKMADPARAAAASEAGKKAVRERYNLEIEGQQLVALYAELEARASSS